MAKKCQNKLLKNSKTISRKSRNVFFDPETGPLRGSKFDLNFRCRGRLSFFRAENRCRNWRI